MKAVVFSGQGAQRVGMGEGLFSQYPQLTAQANAIAGFSIPKYCLQSSPQQLTEMRYLQPALFTINALYYQDQLDHGGYPPDYLAGHSLGEYNALLAAGVFDFATGLKIVKKRGELMSTAHGGGMAAVMGLSETEVRQIMKQNLIEGVYIANYNTPKQFLLAGPAKTLAEAEAIFYDHYARKYILLNADGAFYSPYMNEASLMFEQYLGRFDFKAPKIPVIANLNGEPYYQHAIAQQLSTHINHPVRWQDCISYLKRQGVTAFFELGGSTLLRNMIKFIPGDGND